MNIRKYWIKPPTSSLFDSQQILLAFEFTPSETLPGRQLWNLTMSTYLARKLIEYIPLILPILPPIAWQVWIGNHYTKKYANCKKKSNYKNSASGLYLHFGIFSNKPSWPTLSTWYGCIIHLQTSHKKSRLLADLMFFHLRPLPSSLQRDLLSVLVIFPELDVLHVGFRVKVKILKLLVMSGPDLCTDLEQIWRGNAKKHDTYNTKIDIEYVCILK